MQPVPSPLSTPPPPPLRSHWQRVALPVQLLTLIVGIMLLGSVRCEHRGAEVAGRAITFTPGLEDFVVEQQPGGQVSVQDGALVIEDLGGCTVWYRHKLRAPIEITYEAQVVMQGGPYDRLSDLNCFWMASSGQSSDELLGAHAARNGAFSDYDTLATYYVGYGGNANTTTRFRRYDGTGARPLLAEHDLGDSGRNTAVLLRPNHVYQIRLITDAHGRTEYWRDGECLFAYDDPEPLREGYFGLRTVNSHLVVRNLRIQSR